MTITANMVLRSHAPTGCEIMTFMLRYPKFIHSEFMTHRQFSRNASSSRAVPVAKLLNDIEKDMAAPISWGRNQKGMQAKEELSAEEQQIAKDIWYQSGRDAIANARKLLDQGVHKQITNRIVEPYSHINVLFTTTSLDNFFTLRLHPDAQPEMQELACQIKNAYDSSISNFLDYNEWHLPYVQKTHNIDEFDKEAITNAIKVSVARCARVSYLTFEGKIPSVEEDLKLYEKLVGSVPLHASPAEHQATPDRLDGVGWKNPDLHGNLAGFIQYRKQLEQNI